MNEKKKKEQNKPLEKDPVTEAKSSTRKGRNVVLVLIVLSLLWYLMADRFTPCTSQARVQGYVVGVAPKVAGLVTEVWVTNNQEVAEGQSLFTLDASQYEIALEKAKSDLETSKRQVDAGSAAVESARANLLSAKANERKAQQDYSRLDKLRKEDPGTISMRRLEVAQATLEQAKAQVTAAESAIQQAIQQKGGEDDSNNAILRSAQSAVDDAVRNLSNTVVIASTKGMITDLQTDVGQYASSGSPVLTLISMHDVWIEAQFSENNLGNLRAGTRVEILLDILPGRIFAGKVRSVGLGVSDGQTATAGTLPTIENNRDWLRQAQRFPVVISIDETADKDLQHHLRIGGQATVIGYSDGHFILNLLGKMYIRLTSLFEYAY